MKNKKAPTDSPESDVFDRIMSLKLLKPLFPFYQKHKEVILYIFFGSLTFLVNVATFALLKAIIHHLIANIVAWLAGVFFAFVTNRLWVFKSAAKSFGKIVIEFLLFAIARLASLGLEEVLLWIGIDIIGLNSIFVKITVQVVIIVVNFILGKWVVFRKPK